MQALWLFGWLFAKMFAWEGFGAEQDAAYVLVDDGLVDAQDGSTGGGPP